MPPIIVTIVLFRELKDFTIKLIIREKRKASDDLPGVQTANDQIETNTSRKLSEEFINKKKQKHDERDRNKLKWLGNVKYGLSNNTISIPF